MRQAIDAVAAYIDEKVDVLFGPVLEFLHEAGGVRTTSEIDFYFRDQVQDSTLSNVYEWLADRGVIRKVPAPVRLTRKSQVALDEAAYYYDGGPQPRATPAANGSEPA